MNNNVDMLFETVDVDVSLVNKYYGALREILMDSGRDGFIDEFAHIFLAVQALIGEGCKQDVPLEEFLGIAEVCLRNADLEYKY